MKIPLDAMYVWLAQKIKLDPAISYQCKLQYFFITRKCKLHLGFYLGRKRIAHNQKKKVITFSVKKAMGDITKHIKIWENQNN